MIIHQLFLCLPCVVAGYFIYKFAISLYLKRMRLPPGPTPIPWFGNLLSFRGIHENFYLHLSKMAAEYGEMATVFTGLDPMVILNSVDAIRENLIDNPHDFQSKPRNPIMDLLFLRGEQDIVNAPYNELWKLHKKIAARAMKKIIDSDELARHIDIVLTDLIEKVLNEGGPIKLGDYATGITFSVLMQFCYGESRSFDDPMVLERLAAIRRQKMAMGGNARMLAFLPGAYYIFKYCTFLEAVKVVNARFDAIDSFNNIKLQQHKDKFNPDDPPLDILDAILIEQSEMQKHGESFDKMKHAHVSLLITDIFEAGTETTAMTLRWFFLEMILNPEIQKKCQQQIDEVIGKRAPRLSDRRRLPYLEACLVEVLRMHPPSPFGVLTTQSNPSALLSRKYELPKGTMIAANLLSIHYDGKYFETPNQFKPERFIGPGGILKPPQWLPFGVGKRVCLGEQLAKNDLFLITAGLLQKVSLKPVPGEEYNREPGIKSPKFVPRENNSFIIARR